VVNASHLTWLKAQANAGSGTCTLHPTFLTQVQPPCNHTFLEAPLGTIDLYLDDFIGLEQTPTIAQTVQCMLLYTISQLFCLNDMADIERKQPISKNKLTKGDAIWSTTKTIS